MFQEPSGWRSVYPLNLPPGASFLYTSSNSMNLNDNESPVHFINTFEAEYFSNDLIVAGDRASSQYVLVGALTARRSQTHLTLLTQAKNFDSIQIWQPEIHPGETPEKMVALKGDDWNELLIRYADLAAKENQVELPPRKHNLTGYCTWYYYYKEVTAADFYENVEALGRQRNCGYPAELIQIDDGYQTRQGDWLERSDKWPEPLEDVCKKITRYGMTPGIWLMPFIASTASRVYQEHPGWFLQTPDGTPAVSRGWTPPPDHLWAVLDLTLPDVQAHLKTVFQTFWNIGFRYFKLDGLAFALKQGRRHDPKATSVSAFRLGLKLICEAVPEALLLGCCPAMLPCLGLTPMVRISDDTKAQADTLLRAVRTGCARWWMLDRWYWGDPDVMIARSARSTLTPGENRISVLMGCLTGVALTSDNLNHLSEAERSLLERGARYHLEQLRPWGECEGGGWQTLFTGTIQGKCAFAGINDTAEPLEFPLVQLVGSDCAEELLEPRGTLHASLRIPPHDAVLCVAR